jgi:acyl-CoA synthetase (NDP forming)
MTIHALTRILNPKSIAVIGASSRENNLGHWLLRSIINGGYTGSVCPVNPKGGEILGLQVITDIESLPDSIDLAIASIPAPAVPQTIASLGTKGPAGVVVVAGGFAEVGDEGKALQQELTSAPAPL